jgi:hypothetical protein
VTTAKLSDPGNQERNDMLHFEPNSDLDHKAFGEEIDRLDALVADLWRVSILKRPEPSVIRSAPILEDWRLAFHPSLCLVGSATGHPKLPGHRRTIVTSGLWMFSENLSLGRTESRWYRLERPASDLSKDS